MFCSFFPPLIEHWNYLGVDETLGPVAVSLRREKLDDHKEHGPQYNYRVIFRTSEVSVHSIYTDCYLEHLLGPVCGYFGNFSHFRYSHSHNQLRASHMSSILLKKLVPTTQTAIMDRSPSMQCFQ